MNKKPYLPSTEADRITWLNNFAVKIGNYSKTFGISDDEVKLIQAMAIFYSFVINLIDNSRKFTKALTNFKNILSRAANGTTLGDLPAFNAGVIPVLTQSGIFTFISGIVGRIKSNTVNYTETIGNDLGIIGAETEFVPDNYSANGECGSMPGYVKVGFNKKYLDSMDIFGNAIGGDTKVFVKIGNAAHSPWHDTRPLAIAGVPENRNYQNRGVIHDAEIGHFSDTFSCTFNG